MCSISGVCARQLQHEREQLIAQTKVLHLRQHVDREQLEDAAARHVVRFHILGGRTLHQ